MKKSVKINPNTKITVKDVHSIFTSLYTKLPPEQKERFDKELLKLSNVNIFDERELSRLLLAKGFKVRETATILNVDSQIINQFNGARLELGDYDNRKDETGKLYDSVTNKAPSWTLTTLREYPKYANHLISSEQFKQLVKKHPMLKNPEYKSKIKTFVESDV